VAGGYLVTFGHIHAGFRQPEQLTPHPAARLRPGPSRPLSWHNAGMRLVINGENRDLEGVETLSSLLEHLDLKADRVAVELNREIVGRDLWAKTPLREGDRLEIVQFVGGG
jgi:sulfur carrier protein